MSRSGRPEADTGAAVTSSTQALASAIRIGLAAYGLVHLLVAWIAVQLAWHDAGGSSADSTGALRSLAGEPLGDLLLWVVALGFVALALWQAMEAIWGHRRHDGAARTFHRLGSAGRVVVYLALAYSAVQILTTSGGSGGNQVDSLSSDLMQLPAGQLIVGAVGLGIVAVGGYIGYKGVSRSFVDDLEMDGTSGERGRVIVRVGQFGHLAKGVALAIVGALFVWAALTYDPKKAGGLDAALTELRGQSLGPWLLTIVAVGIGCYGLYCFAWARYARDV
jgi:hypothetical protein